MKEKNKKPNILVILSDEHTPNVSGFGGDTCVNTQHLDALAEKSFQFDCAVCPSPVCTSSRMAMLTAKEPHNCSAWNSHWVIFPEHKTWPQHFADHGYATCLVGKMHFGGKDQMQGFQHRPYGDMKHGLGHQPEPMSKFPCYDNPESAGITEIPESLNSDVVTTIEATSFILEHENEKPEQPWFTCIGYTRPHAPLRTPGRYYNKYKGKTPPPKVSPAKRESLEPYAKQFVYGTLDEAAHAKGRDGYYACVDFVDDCIGDLLTKLDNAGSLDNTIIIYSSDHGEMLGEFGLWGKCVYYDPSIRIPMLISGPGISSGHHSTNKPISLIDLYPTTCALAGLPVPEGLNGYDFSGFLQDPGNNPAPREYVSSAYYKYGILVGGHSISADQKHAAMRTTRNEKYKYVTIDKGEELLFDLEKDPLELSNIISDPSYSEILHKLKTACFEDFNWDLVHQRLEEESKRLGAFKSGVQPSMPNQYRFPDGRMFDAETELYKSRWLNIESVTGGLIPQRFG